MLSSNFRLSEMFNLGMYDTIISYGEKDPAGKAATH